MDHAHIPATAVAGMDAGGAGPAARGAPARWTVGKMRAGSRPGWQSAPTAAPNRLPGAAAQSAANVTATAFTCVGLLSAIQSSHVPA